MKQAQLLTSEVSWGDLPSRDYSSTKMGENFTKPGSTKAKSAQSLGFSLRMMVWSRGSKEQLKRHQKMDSDQQKENNISNSLCFFLNFMAFRIKSLKNSIECTCRPFTLELDHLDAGLEIFEVIIPVASVGFSGEIQLIWTS